MKKNNEGMTAFNKSSRQLAREILSTPSDPDAGKVKRYDLLIVMLVTGEMKLCVCYGLSRREAAASLHLGKWGVDFVVIDG